MSHLTLQDIQIGMDIFVAHPFYGINHYTVLSMPYIHESIKSYFIKCKVNTSYGNYVASKSLSDAGITAFYNSRRSFKTLKEAEAYVETAKVDPTVIAQHARHLELNKEWDKLFPPYEEDM